MFMTTAPRSSGKAYFEWLKPKKVLRGLVYTALMVAVLFLGFQLLRAGFEHSGKSFINWFYVNRQEIGQIDEYFYFLFVGLGFFIISVLYYFTIASAPTRVTKTADAAT